MKKYILPLRVVAIVFGLGLLAGTAEAVPRSMKLTFTNFVGHGTLNNFPLLVKLNVANTLNYDGFLDTVNGYDLRFYDNAALTGTPLNYEYETFNAAGESLVWVKVPALTHNGAIWASWGVDNSQQASLTDGSTWSEGFGGVWHLKDDLLDSTPNNNHGTQAGSIETDGMIGRGQLFDGSGDDINCGNDASLKNPNTITVSCWMRASSIQQWAGVIGRGNDRDYELEYPNTSSMRFRVDNDGGQAPTVSVALNTWYYMVGTYGDGADAVKIYQNGVLKATRSTGAIADRTENLLIGSRGGGNEHRGEIDEARVSTVARSADWIWASYLNQGVDHATFMSYDEPIIPIIANIAPSELTSVSATFNASLSGEGKTYDVYVHWGPTDGGEDPAAWSESRFVGSWTDVAATNISVWTNGFDWETEYFYTFQASNATENIWPPTPISFTTLEGPKSLYSMAISFTNFVDRGTLTDFPALVKLTTANTESYAGFLDTIDGYDLRFYDNAWLSGTPLAYEIESFNASGDSYIWVKVPALTQGTTIWAAWGDDATQQASTTDGSVWGSQFKAVWHMGEATGLALDATDNDHDATSKGGFPSSVTGLIGGANDFVDAESDYMKVPAHDDFRPIDQMTVSAWIYNDSNGGDEAIIGTYNGGFMLVLNSSDDFRYYCNNVNWKSSGNTIPVGTWSHVAVVYDEDNPAEAFDGTFYVNGIAVGNAFDIDDYTGRNNLTIGAGGESWTGNRFDGLIDEVRFSRAARSPDWMWASYMNQGADHDAFVSYGTVQSDTAVRWTFPRTYDVLADQASVEGLINTDLTGATLVWALSDMGTNSVGDWTFSRSLGAQVAGPVLGVITGLVADTIYSWRLYGTTASTDAWSPANPFSMALSAAQKPVFTNAVPDEDSIRLYWTDNATYETSYVIERSTNGTEFVTHATLAADTEYYWDTGLAAGTYYYRLSALNESNGSSTDATLATTNAVCAGPDLFGPNSGAGGAPSPPAGAINPATGLAWSFGDTYQLVFLTSTEPNVAGDEDIHHWNDYVNTIADGSSLAGVPALTWKVLASDVNTDARDNALVSAPVFLLDGTTRIADGYTDMWDGNIEAGINRFENGAAGSGENEVWTGSYVNGTKVANRELGNPVQANVYVGYRTRTDRHWFQNRDRGQTDTKRFYALSMPLTLTNGVPSDTTPPSPSTMTWAIPPVGLLTNTITMSATLAYDLESPAVEYFFTNTVTGTTRGWSEDRSWTETVAASSIHAYKVKARDAVGNETGWSSESSATPLNKGPNGLWAPTGNHPVTGEPWQPGDTYHLVFATTTEPTMSTDYELIYWDDYVKSIADGSSLPGMSNVNWKVLASSPEEHARDHAAVMAPVFRTDGETMVATGYSDMWDGSIRATISYDQNGNYYSGENEVWTGSNSDGTGKGSREVGNTLNTSVTKGRVDVTSGGWFSNGERSDTDTKRLYGLSQLLGVVDLVNGDTSPPLPNPMSFSVGPKGLTSTSVTMRATLAYDLESGPVEYLFTNASTHASSVWQSSPEWVDYVVLGRANTYMVKARDAVGIEGDWSAPVVATPVLTGPSGILAPIGINPDTGKVWTGGDTYHLMFVTSTEATTSSDGDIAVWDAHVNTVAGGSALTGVSSVDWKAVLSTPAVQARDHALVTAPVYQMDGESMLADGFADMWDSDNEILLDESGLHYTLSGSENEAWTGSYSTGTKVNNREVGNPSQSAVRTGHFPAGSGNWFSNRDRGQTETKRFYALSEPLTIAYTAVDVVNGAATNVDGVSAELVGYVSAPLGQTLDVSVYWSTNNNAGATAWLADTSALSAPIGSYTDVLDLQISKAIGSLDSGTVYYYTLLGTNADVMVWATPNTQFGTFGPPAVANVGSTAENGYATLTGDLLSTGGTTTTVRVYWGDADGGMNAASWAHTNIVSTDQAVGLFATDTDTGLTYGVPYFFRSHASNDNGQVWATETVEFLTDLPYENVYGAGLSAYGYHINNDNVAMNLDNNGGMFAGGDPTTFQNYYGTSLLTTGPGNRGLDFNQDSDFINAGLVNQVDNYSTLFTGYFIPPQTGTYGFRNAGDDDRAGIWFDLNQNGVFESSSPGLGDNREEQMSWENTSWRSRNLVAGERYLVAFTHREGGGGSRCDFRFRGPGISGEPIIKPADAAQAGMWVYLDHTDILSVSNMPVSAGYTANEATFNAHLAYPDRAVVDVYVYWGTNNGANVAGNWGHTNVIGSYTNVAPTNLHYDATGLTKDTRYYYAFMAENMATNLWAEPSETFQTLGSLEVENSVTSHVGYASLYGVIPVGGQADVTVVWGTSDAGTNSGVNAWDNVVPLGNHLANAEFSTDTVDAWHGITYYTRTYAVNVTGEAWSDVIAFSVPKAIYVQGALQHRGWDVVNDDSNMDLDNNGGFLALTPDGITELTSGPGGRGIDFNSDTDFLDTGLFTSGDTFANLFLGYFTAPETGEFRFKINQEDDTAGIWLDLDRDEIFESSIAGLGNDRGEQLAWNSTGEHRVDLEAGRVYKFTGTHREGGSGSGVELQLRIPSVGYYYTIKPTDPAQAGLWKYDDETPLELGLFNGLVSDISAGKATLNATFKCEKAVYDLWAYWSTTDGGTNAATWEATGNKELVGSFTNITALTDIAHPVIGLAGEQNYYYTFRATNEFTDLWAEPSTDFVSAGPPTVSHNGGATDEEIGGATLNGKLIGGGGADAYFCWGLTDGGTNSATDWEHVIPMGAVLEGTPFATNINGTLFGIEYDYRVLASNGLGTAWSDVDGFWTLMPVAPAIPVTDNLVVWFDAGVGVTHVANNVSQWEDQSGNSHTAVKAAGTMTLQENAVNGLPVVRLTDNTYANLAGSMFIKQQYIVFSLENGGDWGAVIGSSSRSGYLLNRSGYFWNANYPEAVRQNGGAELTPNYQLSSIGTYMVVRITGNSNNTSIRSGWMMGRQEGWDTPRMKLAEVIGYDTTLSSDDESLVGDYLAQKYGITTGYSGYEVPQVVRVQPTLASDLTATTATLNGTLDATNSVFTVEAFWSTSNNTSAAEWLGDTTAGSATFDTYTNVMGHAIGGTAPGLGGGAPYYFTFRISNPQTNVWAATNGTFETVGAPTITTGSGATDIAEGIATLHGLLTGGGAANATICWGTTDSGTNNTIDWEYTEDLGEVLQDLDFSTNLTGLIYGYDYQYRVFATNDNGSSWSSVTNFTTLFPRGEISYPGLLSGTLSGTLNLVDPNPENGDGIDSSITNMGPRRALAAGWGTDSTYVYSGQMWFDGSDYFFVASVDDSTWLTIDGTNYINDTTWNIIDTSGLISKPEGWYDFELRMGNGTGGSGPVSLNPGFQYHNGGGTSDAELDNWYPEDPGDGSLFRNSVSGVDAVGIVNTSATNILATTAELIGSLDATQSVFNVYAYWSTNSANTNAALWLADTTASNAYVGTFTNVVGEVVTREIVGLERGDTYYYTFMATNVSTNIWATPALSFTTDGTPPSPDPMGFEIVPSSKNETTVTMVASNATDLLNGPVEYYFNNTSNSNFRGWSTNTTWNDTGLTEGETYGYQVVARDAVSNETAWSDEYLASPVVDLVPPSPSNMVFAVAPYPANTGLMAMQATNAFDVNGPVEYLFENTTNLVNSGWVTSTIWTNSGLDTATYYGYRVKARDAYSNETAWSATLGAFTVDTFPPNSGPGGMISPLSGTINPETGVSWAVGDTYQLVFVTSTTTNMLAREDIHFWNDYVNTVADGSSLQGVSNLTWRVLGSDLTTHAKDNAVVIAPTYLMDASTKVVDDFADMWDSSIDAAISKDESGTTVGGENEVWTGSRIDGTTGGDYSFDGANGNVYRGFRDATNNRWFDNNVVGRSSNFRLYALSQPMSITNGVDLDVEPPEPSTMTWGKEPTGLTTNAIEMVATLAYDLISAPVEYFFTNTVTHEVRTWDLSARWTNAVSVNSLNTYRVKARDAVGLETEWSAPFSATPVLKGPSGVVAPGDLHPVTGVPWKAGDIYQLAFVSSTLTNMLGLEDIHFWNEYINRLADSSTLTGVSNLTWKVMGSDLTHHAKDNALVSAPVYLLDGVIKIADNYADIWDGTIDAPVSLDENANVVGGEDEVWTGSQISGISDGAESFNGSSGNAERGWRTDTSSRWLANGGNPRNYDRRLYGLSQPIRIWSGAVDTNSPVPTTMTWAVAPVGLTTNTVEMKATLAYDLDSLPVEYLITNSVTHEVRDWALNPSWTNTVPAGSLNTYMVKARDGVGNETAWSAPYQATPLLEGPQGVLAPLGLHPINGVPWQAGDIYQLTFVSSTLTNMLSLQDIHFWNDHINTVADGSSMTAVSNVTWKVIGSDTSTHAKNNALLTAPLYRLDGVKVVDGYGYLWSGVIGAAINVDENGNPGTGTDMVWTGSDSAGNTRGSLSFDGSNGSANRGQRTEVTYRWVGRDSIARGNDYHLYGMSQPLRISSGAADTTPPEPSTMTWAKAPKGVTATTIEMAATLAYDLDSLGVEYLFTNTYTAASQSWSSERRWTDTVVANSLNAYKVKARDAKGNETAWSDLYLTTPLLNGPNGVVAPSGTNPTTGQPWQGGDIYHLAFVSSPTYNMSGREDIQYWNSSVQTLAAASSIPGVAGLQWRALGSDTETHARNNAPVVAPVYLMDGETKLTDGYNYLWAGSVNAPLNIDENGNPASGSDRVWTGSSWSGGSGAQYSFNGSDYRAYSSQRTQVNSYWFYRDAQSRVNDYHIYGMSQPIMVGDGTGDVTPPTPSPMTFHTAPYGSTQNAITMRATEAYDLENPGVQYYFENTVTLGNSGWQLSPDWTETVTPGVANTYHVKAKDAVGNETDWSPSVTVKALLKGPNGIIAPTGVNPTTGALWKDGDIYHLAFASSTLGPATTGHDINWWNSYVDGIADGSTLTGVPQATWKIIGSTVATHAKNNALVSAPVYLLDGSTLLAYGYSDMWDGQQRANLNIDESGNAVVGGDSVWTGSYSSGNSAGTSYALDGSSGNCYRGQWNYSSSYWIQRDTRSRSSSYRFYGLSEPLTIQPAAISIVLGTSTNIGADTADLTGALTAPLGQEAEVTVYWSQINNTSLAEWQADFSADSLVINTYSDVIGQAVTGSVGSLAPNTAYYYTMIAANPQVTAWAGSNLLFSADTTPPVPGTMSFASAPEPNGVGEIVMTAITVTDALNEPVSYYFENLSNGVHSGWVSSPTWANTALDNNTTYGYRVRARDAVGNVNEWSDAESATTSIPWDWLVAYWSFDDADVSGTTILDAADDPGYGQGDHDATMVGGLRPSTDLPGDPNGGLVGNYFNANDNGYAIVDTFGGSATHSNLNAGEQITIAGWFQEQVDENWGVYLSKFGDSGLGWDIRGNGNNPQIVADLRGSSGNDTTSAYAIEANQNGGPWYFVAMTYSKESDTSSIQRFYTADSAATDKGLKKRGADITHSTDNDVADTGSMVVLGAYDTSNDDQTAPTVGRAGSIKMDEIAIWNKGLTLEELTAWYGLSYFSGLKPNSAAITILLTGAVGTTVTDAGPHNHTWQRIANAGTEGDLSGSIATGDALIQFSATEALQFSLSGVADDTAATDERTPVSIAVLDNDEINSGLGSAGALEITLITQPTEGTVTIDNGNQTLTYDPSGSTVLSNLLAGEVSVQTFDYTAQNTNTLNTAVGTVSVTVNGVASFGDALVAHWTFDDVDVSGSIVLDLADDAGDGKGDHDATMSGGTRPNTDLPGDPNGGLAGNYFDANGNNYAVVDAFGGAATHHDLDAGEQITVAGWFRERADENEGVYMAKYGDSNLGWDIRQGGNSPRIRSHLRGSSGTDNSTDYYIQDDMNDGPWYFVAMSYTKESDYMSRRRFITANSGAADKRLVVRSTDSHSTDNDVADTGAMVVLGARDVSNFDTTPPSISRPASVRMDDIAIWNRGLSLEELTAWYGLAYFSGVKATDEVIETLLAGAVGTVVTNVGPHGHNWTKISTNGTAGNISGTVADDNGLVQLTATEGLLLSIPDVVANDTASTDESTPLSIDVLVNDKLDGSSGGSGNLTIPSVTQPAEGVVTIDGGSLAVTYDPSGSTVLRNLLAGETSEQVFTYAVSNTLTSLMGTGTVTVTVNGLPSFSDSLVAHWTFDDANVTNQIARDIADDAGFGKGDHDATMSGGTRPDTDLPGDPNGGLRGNYFNANGANYAVVNSFGGAAAHTDLDANDQFTVAGWFRERPDGNEDAYISKYGDNYGWEIRRSGSGSSVRTQLQKVSAAGSSSSVGITSDDNGGPWYFIAVSYKKDNELQSVRRFYTADSDAADKRLFLRWTGIHSPDNDSDSTGSMMVIGARDNSNNAFNAPSLDRHSGAKFDDIAFWNRGLTQAELTAWYGLSYFSGIKATDPAITTLLDGPVGTTVTNLPPHTHNWTKINTNGIAGAISGTILAEDALIQISATEALKVSIPDIVLDDSGETDEETPLSMSVLVNDKIDSGLGGLGALEIFAVTQPTAGLVTIDAGAQSLTFDPSADPTLRALEFGDTSEQTFTYTARNTNTLTTGTGTVTVVISGVAAFGDALVAYWTFDPADVSGSTILDMADDAGYGKGSHDAIQSAGTLPTTDLPGDPDGGLEGAYFNANGNGYAVVKAFSDGAVHTDLDAKDQFTLVGWFRERPDGNEEPYISKEGNSVGWDLRRNGGGSSVRTDLRSTSGADNPSAYTITSLDNGGPWYFMAVSYTKQNELQSVMRFYTADSDAVDKRIYQRGAPVYHSPDNDASSTGSMLVMGARDSSNNEFNNPSLDRQSNTKMDDVAFWNRGLTLEEVTALYGLSYFSGVKATDATIATLLDSAVGTVVTNVGPHAHTWTKISTNGAQGDVTGSVIIEDAMIQLTATEALQLSIPSVVGPDVGATDEATPVSIVVLDNDKIGTGRGVNGDLDILSVTQPAEGGVTIDGGAQTLTFDPAGSPVLEALAFGDTSVQTFNYVARNTNTLELGTGTVSVTVGGIASFSDALVAHWTFDDADISGSLALDVADDAGYGKGGHDAFLSGGTRPSTGLPGDPSGGPVGNYFNANGSYGIVSYFDGAAANSDLDAGEQFSVAGWFRERPDGSYESWISKDDNAGWRLRRDNANSAMRFNLNGTSGTDDSTAYPIEANDSGTRWYFMAASYTKYSDFKSTLRFYAADSAAADKGIDQIGADQVHGADNDVTATASMVVFGAHDAAGVSGQSNTRMDDIAIWNRGLTMAEVAGWYGLSYFSGLKATNSAITVLLDGPVGTELTELGPHDHAWQKIANAGTAGDISGTVAGEDAMIQITDTEALQYYIPDYLGDDSGMTDEETPVSVSVLLNDRISDEFAGSGALEIIAVTQPTEGTVTIDSGGQSLTFNPSGSAALASLAFGASSVQTFGYTARNTNTTTTGNGNVSVTVVGLGSFSDALVAHWTFDDADVSGSTVLDLADDAGYGLGGHNATLNGGTRPGADLPGYPGAGLVGNYFDANANGYAIVDTFDDGAVNGDLDAGDQFTVAGWFRELPDATDEPWISKDNGGSGWRLHRNGNAFEAAFGIYGTSGSDSSNPYTVTSLINGGNWYFMAATYRKFSDTLSVLRFYGADSGAGIKDLSQIGPAQNHTPDNDVTPTASKVVFGAHDVPGLGIDNRSSIKVDDVAIWKRGLNVAELTAWYGLSYFSGLKATDPAIQTLLDAPLGTVMTDLGPHLHAWQKVAHSGTAGAVSGTLLPPTAVIQISDTEAIKQYYIPPASMFMFR